MSNLGPLKEYYEGYDGYEGYEGYEVGQLPGGSKVRTPQPTNHTLYVVFKKELRHVEIGIWKENLHGNTIEFQWASICFHILYHCVAVRVS